MNKTRNYILTILIPIYNEEENIYRLQEVINEYLPICPVSACVLFVNDGSTDNSLEFIQDICNRNSHFYYISLLQNGGLSTAIKAGFDWIESKYIGYMDADMQTDIREFNKLLGYISEYPLVTGIRVQRKDSFFKRLQSKVANSFRRMITRDKATDTGCPLKILQTVYAKRIPLFTGMHRFLPALVLLQDGGDFYEIPISHYPRKAGSSKYYLWNRLVSSFVDCFVYRWIAHRYINYQIRERNL